jgi:hypothetical protein
LWQFIPSTGKRFNLEQNFWHDQRRDVMASTSAAIDYLHTIYEMHGDWHLALALAAGQVSGVVQSADGRKILVKGDTHKDRSLKISFEEVGKKGEMREVRTFTDKFVPVIRGIEFTPGPMLGNLVSIR